jgi:hypothetical protein
MVIKLKFMIIYSSYCPNILIFFKRILGNLFCQISALKVDLLKPKITKNFRTILDLCYEFRKYLTFFYVSTHCIYFLIVLKTLYTNKNL